MAYRGSASFGTRCGSDVVVLRSLQGIQRKTRVVSYHIVQSVPQLRPPSRLLFFTRR
jgi:hypothetical protein